MTATTTVPESLSLPQKYCRYSRERFPLPGVLLYTGAQYYAAYCFGGLLPGATPMSLGQSLLGWTMIVLVLLRLRVSDDHKDLSRDVQAYPHRLLSQGRITIRELYGLFFIALGIELLIGLALGWRQMGVWLGINAWFLLMHLEFFAPTFLNAHIGWYLVTHQLLVPALALLPLSQRIDLAAVSPETIGLILALLAAILFGTMTYEVARKIWSPDREHPCAVSYSRDWGRQVSVGVDQGFALISVVLLLLLQRHFELPPLFSLLLVVAYLPVPWAGLAFLRRPERARAQRIEAAGLLFLLIALTGSAAAFAWGPS